MRRTKPKDDHIDANDNAVPVISFSIYAHKSRMDGSRIQRYGEELANACEFKSQSPCAQYFAEPVRASNGFPSSDVPPRTIIVPIARLTRRLYKFSGQPSLLRGKLP
jgi:hypothetical protein